MYAVNSFLVARKSPNVSALSPKQEMYSKITYKQIKPAAGLENE